MNTKVLTGLLFIVFTLFSVYVILSLFTPWVLGGVLRKCKVCGTPVSVESCADHHPCGTPVSVESCAEHHPCPFDDRLDCLSENMYYVQKPASEWTDDDRNTAIWLITQTDNIATINLPDEETASFVSYLQGRDNNFIQLTLKGLCKQNLL
jgi:hypothetical protein